MKIAGKDPNGKVKGIAVTENGEVKVQQTGSIVAEGKLFDAYAPTTSDVFDSSTPGTGGDDYIDLTKLRNISFLVECTLDVDVKFVLSIGGRSGYNRVVYLYPDESGNFTNTKRLETMLKGSTFNRYYFVNNAKQISDFNSFSGVPGLSRLYVQIEPQGVPTEGSITVYYRGDVIEVQN